MVVIMRYVTGSRGRGGDVGGGYRGAGMAVNNALGSVMCSLTEPLQSYAVIFDVVMKRM